MYIEEYDQGEAYTLHRCGICKKEFRIPKGSCDKWVYQTYKGNTNGQYPHQYFCSYTCLRAYEKTGRRYKTR